MSARRAAQIGLLLVVAVTAVLLLRPQTPKPQTPVDQTTVNSGVTWVAYYFHGDRRCDTCRSIEAQAETAVEEGFADELASGTLEWRVVNTDRPENAHFNEDFGLSFSTVVVVEREGDQTRRFVTLDRVWELAHDPDEFRNYVQQGIADWLGSGS